jgi:phosphoglycerate kinase
MKLFTTHASYKKVHTLVRIDVNVPIENGKIQDSFRIDKALRTIDMLLKKGAYITLIAHHGTEGQSLEPVARYMAKKGYDIHFVQEDIFDKNVCASVRVLATSGIVFLENIRSYEEEEKNSVTLAKAIASLGDVYINEAFSVSHRKHASIVGVPKLLPSYAGYQLFEEVKALSVALDEKKHPFLFLLGGAKFATKVPLIKKYIARADGVFVGGAILNTLLEAGGFPIGASVSDSAYLKEAKKIIKEPTVLMATDVVVEEGKTSIPLDEVGAKDVIVDIGRQTTALLIDKLQKAKLVVWNGPFGWYEKKYDRSTVAVAKALLASKAQVIIGGGDTASAIQKILKGKALPKNVFISTGGGATLDFLSQGTLPGIEALGK